MPGTVIVKPLIANFDNELSSELVKDVTPYCVVTVGDKKVRGLACKKSGKTPFWKGTYHVPRKEEHYAFVEIKNHQIAPHEVLGVSKIDLEEVDKEGPVTKWYDIFYKKKPAGQILIEVKMETSDQPEQFLEFNEPEGGEISPIKPVPQLSKQDSGFDLNVRNFVEKPILKDRGTSNPLSQFAPNSNNNPNNLSEEIDKNGLSGIDFSNTTGNDSTTFKEGPADENVSKVDLGDSLPLIKVEDDMLDGNMVVTKEAGNLNASAYI